MEVELEPKRPPAARYLERLVQPLERLFDKVYTPRFDPLYQSGAVIVLLLAIVTITGVYLLFFYQVSAPYESVSRLNNQVWLGRWVRTLHRYASDACVVVIAYHALRFFIQGKTWGPRVLAWVTGIFLLLAVLVCGWTGLVLVWDRQGQILAVEGARLFDALPIFSEPIGRAFVSNQALPESFFFLNLFLHVALPLGIVALLIMHVIRLHRPLWFPKRDLSWRLLLTFVLFSMIWPAALNEQADLLSVPGKVDIDWFFSFWVPVADVVAPRIHWLLWVVLILLGLLAPIWWRPSRDPGKEKPLAVNLDDKR